MASTEEVLKALQNAKITTLAATEPEELVIDAETRTITVPSSERLFGVTGDMNIERKYFRCPKIVGDNVDLSTHQIFIAYVYTETESGSIFPSIGVAPYHCEDVEVDGEDITFSWKLTGNVFKNPGFILFKMYAKKTETDPNTVFNTTPAIGTVLATIPDGTEEIVEEHPDVIAQIFDRLDALESVGGGGTGGTTNYEKLSNKPKLNGVTLEGNKTLDQVGVLAKNQGSNNSGKFLSVGSDGNVVPADAPSGGEGGGGITEETDPTVPAWAKEPTKPTYTAVEVGADASGTAEAKVSVHNTAVDAHSDIRLLVQELTTRLNALADSDDDTLDQMSEIVAYIKSNKSLIDAITTQKVSVTDIIDNLTTNVANKPLSAAQGVVLKALIDGITIPEKLPNPQKIIFTGAVSAEYDGSSQQTINIPTGGGTGGGTTDYNDLSNKPQLGGVTLEGNKTLDDIGAQPKGNYLTDVPQASSTIIGGIKAESAGAEDTVPVKIKSDGTLAVPTYPEGGSGSGGITVSYDAEQQAIVFTNSSGRGN